MENEKWGVGNATQEKAFATVKMKNGEVAELFHGEHPHSRQDNSTYARMKDGTIHEFSGHRMPFKLEIEEYNYLKSSSLSGDEIRKGCSVKIFCNGVQIYDEFHRNYEAGYRIAHQFILDMELHWSWFPHNVKKNINRFISYREHPCKIKSFIIDQAAMIIETLDNKPFPIFAWEDKEDYEKENTIKVEITSPHITWYPNYAKKSPNSL